MTPLNTPSLGDLPADVQQALQQGHKVLAVKLLRDARGIGLQEAKDLLEQSMGYAPDDAPPVQNHSPPGQVPSGAGLWKWVIGLLLLGLVYLVIQFFG